MRGLLIAGGVAVAALVVAVMLEPGSGEPIPTGPVVTSPPTRARLPRDIVVPSVVGLPVGDATRRLQEIGLRAVPRVPDGADAGLVAAAEVISHDPPAAARARPDTEVLLVVHCEPTCAAPSVSTAAGRCDFPPELETPVIEPSTVERNGRVRVRGPAFPGAPKVTVLVSDTVVASGTADASCVYEVAFTAPAEPGRYTIEIRLDPAARIEPPFDLTVT